MIEIGGKPILWHIMKIYSAHGVNDFVICCGYKGYVIKEYFANYFLHMSDVTFDMADNQHRGAPATGRAVARDAGRHRREHDDRRAPQARRALHQSDERLLLHLRRRRRRRRHRALRSPSIAAHGKLATVTAVRPPGRFGALELEATQVTGFTEKPRGDGGLINGGFFVLSPRVSRSHRRRRQQLGSASRSSGSPRWAS